jgi:hypothetical protein
MKNFNELLCREMIGQVCWGVCSGQINLSFNLGNPRLLFEGCQNDPLRDRQLRKYTRVKGQWFLWVYNSYWKLTVLDASGEQKLTVSTSSTDKKKNKVCPLLCGQKLTHVSVNHTTGETKLLFDLGAELNIRRPDDKAKELWLLYGPDDYCLSINGNGTYDYKPSSGTDTRPIIENASIQENIEIGLKIK